MTSVLSGHAPSGRRPGSEPVSPAVAAAASDVRTVLQGLSVDPAVGLEEAEVPARRQRWGDNVLTTHRTRALPVLARQLRSPLLGLLVVAAVASYFVGERSGAVVIGAIIALSVGLGFANEYRAGRAADALHAKLRQETTVLRDGQRRRLTVNELVRGDIVELRLGDVVPADIRLLATVDLSCDESVLTGEAMPVGKSAAPSPKDAALAETTACVFMGTVVHGGSATGVVVATGLDTEFGAIAAGLGSHELDTEFQIGLRRFSLLLAYVAGLLTASIFVINVVLSRPVIDALLFSLAIAVGITPQLLPAVVSTSLAAGSRRMSARKVLVKRLVCIEHLGDVDVLFTDKTGTLTDGRVAFSHAIAAGTSTDAQVVRWGLVATEVEAGTTGPAIGGNALDRALWSAAPPAGTEPLPARRAVLPFDHERQMVSVLAGFEGARPTLVTKGAPEAVLARCVGVDAGIEAALAAEFAGGNRVVAVAIRAMRPETTTLSAQDERELTLVGLLVFLDPPKPGAAAALARLERLGISVKVVTGDNAAVATKVCHDLGLAGERALTGRDIAALDDADLARAIPTTTVFARVTPADKARIVRLQRQSGGGVAFLGDGVNDSLALHAADVGISVDSATDVAKDAADVILLEKDLDVLADGVAEGRRIFANTIKYVLMGTSSNFGNMFSAAGASIFLSFLPMLPSQILLNNLLYDTSQLAIPTDHVDEEQLARPAHWDIRFIRRFMVIFGPLSSVFDFVTFGVMLWVFHAGAARFRSGWFVESLATQTLVIFAIRTRKVPFFRSRPSAPLAVAAVGIVALGSVLPFTPFASTLGFRALPAGYFAALALMVVAYLGLIEVGKRAFYRAAPVRARARGVRRVEHQFRRRLSRFHRVSTRRDDGPPGPKVTPRRRI